MFDEKNVFLYSLIIKTCVGMTFIHRLLFCLVLVQAVALPRSSKAQQLKGMGELKNDFKVTMLSLGSGSSRFTIEHAFSALNSAEATLGLVGLGWDWMNESSPKGLLMKLAYKWRLIMRPDNWLAGFYLKPELVWTRFGYKPQEPTSQKTKITHQAALLAECGYQFLLKRFVLDIYAGLGPSLGTGNDNNYFHSFMLFPEKSIMAFTAGYRIGIAF